MHCSPAPLSPLPRRNGCQIDPQTLPRFSRFLLQPFEARIPQRILPIPPAPAPALFDERVIDVGATGREHISVNTLTPAGYGIYKMSSHSQVRNMQFLRRVPMAIQPVPSVASAHDLLPVSTYSHRSPIALSFWQAGLNPRVFLSPRATRTTKNEPISSQSMQSIPSPRRVYERRV